MVKSLNLTIFVCQFFSSSLPSDPPLRSEQEKMPFKISGYGPGYWDPPRPDVSAEDTAMEEGPTPPRAAGRCFGAL